MRSEHQRCDHLVPLDLLLQVPVGAVLHHDAQLRGAALRCLLRGVNEKACG